MMRDERLVRFYNKNPLAIDDNHASQGGWYMCPNYANASFKPWFKI
jgi:hypothetical protein